MRSTRCLRALHRGDRQLGGASGLHHQLDSPPVPTAAQRPRRPLLLGVLMPHGHHPGFRLNGTAPGNISCFDASLDLKLMASPCYQGTCGGNGSCVCLPGWTGYTDAVPMDTTEWPGGTVLSCGVNTVVVKCLWATAIIPAIAIAAILYPTVRENLRVHHRSRARKQGGTPWCVKGSVSMPRITCRRVLYSAIKHAAPLQVPPSRNRALSSCAYMCSGSPASPLRVPSSDPVFPVFYITQNVDPPSPPPYPPPPSPLPHP